MFSENANKRLYTCKNKSTSEMLVCVCVEQIGTLTHHYLLPLTVFIFIPIKYLTLHSGIVLHALAEDTIVSL